jgi:hypothetical protein
VVVGKLMLTEQGNGGGDPKSSMVDDASAARVEKTAPRGGEEGDRVLDHTNR